LEFLQLEIGLDISLWVEKSRPNRFSWGSSVWQALHPSLYLRAKAGIAWASDTESTVANDAAIITTMREWVAFIDTPF
jgi:hypothetical protein